MRSIAEIYGGQKVIVGMVDRWRVVFITFKLNFLYIQVVLQVMQAIIKTASLKQQLIIMLSLGRMRLLKQFQISS